LLAALPARAADDVAVDKGAYYIALEGVTRYGLQEAARVILKGGLGHTFFPTPVELRQKCDSAMSWHQRERERHHRVIRQTEENAAFNRSDALKTQEARRRVTEVYAEFCAGYDATKPVDRIWLDPELVAQIPDAPTTFKRMK
jgi:hypothetical protein